MCNNKTHTKRSAVGMPSFRAPTADHPNSFYRNKYQIPSPSGSRPSSEVKCTSVISSDAYFASVLYSASQASGMRVSTPSATSHRCKAYHMPSASVCLRRNTASFPPFKPVNLGHYLLLYRVIWLPFPDIRYTFHPIFLVIPAHFPFIISNTYVQIFSAAFYFCFRRLFSLSYVEA